MPWTHWRTALGGASARWLASATTRLAVPAAAPAGRSRQGTATWRRHHFGEGRGDPRKASRHRPNLRAHAPDRRFAQQKWMTELRRSRKGVWVGAWEEGADRIRSWRREGVVWRTFSLNGRRGGTNQLILPALWRKKYLRFGKNPHTNPTSDFCSNVRGSEVEGGGLYYIMDAPNVFHTFLIINYLYLG